jgi:serine/threonine protein kinase
MNPGAKIDRWKLIQDIFQGALEVPPHEQGAYLARACGADQELQSEVASLLANDSSDTATLRFAVAADLKSLGQATCSADSGLRVGPYRLIRELDGGGMGIVYLAVRSDDHYFQIVAIKMVRKGMESTALLQRFRTERQILATLTHPNIGAILDGGDTDDGRPYLVMEYVEGQPITVASETHRLSIRQRIELFRSVCSAVHYAHQKLVIHRDIKPSNVMVTSEGTVKLIDFGISKPLVPELIPGELVVTEGGQRLMTPDYASPEQVLGQPLTTASDIYSLGVLLFELVTGARPYTLRDLSPAVAEKVICQEENRKPSSVSGLAKGAQRELSGDLDTIVLKAMEKDPVRRYAGVGDLDEDLRRFLEGRPIRAKRPTLIYRLSKVFKRHKTASLIAAAALVIVAGSALIFSAQTRAANAQVKQVQALSDSAVMDMTEKLQQSSASVELQASVFHSTITYLNQLRQNSGNDARLLLTLSTAYGRVGDLEGSPFVASLGHTDNAIASYREALRTALAAQAGLRTDESTGAVIEAYRQLGLMESFAGFVPQALDHYQRCLPVAREFWWQKPGDPIRRHLLASTYAGLGFARINNLEPDKALENYRAGLQVLGSDPNGVADHDRTLFTLYGRMGNALNELGSNEESVARFQQAVAVAEDVARKFPSARAKRSVFAWSANFVAALGGKETLNTGQVKMAQNYARKGLAIAEALVASDTTNIQARHDLAHAYTKMGESLASKQPRDATIWYRKAITLTKALPPNSDGQRELAEREEALAALLGRKADAVERLRLVQEANTIRQQMAKAGPHPPFERVRLMRSYCRLSDAELVVNHLAEARTHVVLALPFFAEFKLNSPSLYVLRELGFCYENLGNVCVAAGRSSFGAERRAAQAEAREWYQKSAGVWNEWHRRGAATQESEAERRRVDHLLQTK